MRKTSQDGGESTSATSGVENEIKKPKAGLLEFKLKKIGKRTAPNLSEESDEGVVEPLLQKNTNSTAQSAKYFAKAKADTVKEISKLFNDKKSQYAPTSDFGTTETLLSEKEQVVSKPNTSTNNAPIHNYMNTNVFSSHESSKANGTSKSQILVEIDGSKQSGFNPSSLIFTTAKIHSDGKTKQMEPVQMTPAPIISTIEVSISKSGDITTNEKKVSNANSVNTVCSISTINEKIKENSTNILSSNTDPVTQKNDDLSSKPTKPQEAFTSIATIPTEPTSHIVKQNKVNILNISTEPVTQNNVMGGKINVPSKSITSSSSSMKMSSSPESSKAMTSINSNKSVTANETKILVDEPCIVMSESKLKSTISDNTKTNTSAKTKSPLGSTESTKLSQINQQSTSTNKNTKSDINISSSEPDTAFIKNQNVKEPNQQLGKNIKSPIVTKDFANKLNTLNTNSTKSLQQQKNIPIEVDQTSKTGTKTDTSKNTEFSKDLRAKTSIASIIPNQSKAIDSKLVKEQKNIPIEVDPTSKTETKTDTSKNTEFSKDLRAKTSIASIIPNQSKAIDSKLVKEIDKLKKLSANETSKSDPNKSHNNTANLSSNKFSSSTSVKPARSISSSNSASMDTADKSISSSSLNNSKPPSVTTNQTSNTIKKQVTSAKSPNAAINTKPVSVTSTKSTTKPTSSSSVKLPQIAPNQTSVSKQSNTFPVKTLSNKSPSHTSTKTLKGNTSPSVTTSKPTIGKTAQVSTSKPAGSTAAVETTINTKTKASEPTIKDESKPSEDIKVNTKDIKVSKA